MHSNLNSNDSEQNATSNPDTNPCKNHHTASQLTDEVQQDKHAGNKPSTGPCLINEIALSWPLQPHTQAIVDERTDDTQASNWQENVLSMTQYLQYHQTQLHIDARLPYMYMDARECYNITQSKI